ncbi:hypothetical protein PENTCL1PPCAC_3523, partial [Pristionchus entomophagus]
ITMVKQFTHSITYSIVSVMPIDEPTRQVTGLRMLMVVASPPIDGPTSLFYPAADAARGGARNDFRLSPGAVRKKREHSPYLSSSSPDYCSGVGLNSDLSILHTLASVRKKR